jgi:hypothetical protein
MNSRTILILSVVTAVMAVAAVLSFKSRESLTAAGTSEFASLVPELEQRVNDAAAVTVTSAEGSFRLERSEDGWGAADKGGYPVDFERVKGLVVGVSGFDIVEAKTANPKYHSRLGVADVDAEGSTSTRVTVEDAAGAVLADVIIGEPNPGRGGGAVNQPTQYARAADDPQSYEVTGRVRVDKTLTNWLDKQIMQIERERVARAVVRHPDGEELVVFKASEDDANFSVQDLPEGRELMWPGVADAIGGALAFFNLEDVGAADLIDFDAEERTVTEFTTFDGLIVTITTVEKDEKVYVRASAVYDEAARADDVATVELPPVEGEQGEDPAAEEEDTGKTPEEVLEEAAEINARVTKWTYVVPGYTATNLRKRLDELLKEPEPEPTPEEPAPEPPEVEVEEPASEDG